MNFTFGKKIAAFAVAGTLSLTLLAGCSGGAASSSAAPAASGGSSAPAATGNATPAVDKIKQAGVLKVGVKADVPKFSYKGTDGKFEGFEDDLAKKIAGKILGDENKVEFQAVNAKTRGPLLDNGEIDMVIATFTITDERKKTYDFSDPYFTDGVGLLVKKAANIKGLKDLGGKTIGVAQSATSKDALQKEADKLGIQVKFSEFGTYPEIKAALDSGRVQCFAVDASILNGYVDDSSVILDERYAPQDYGIATKKGNDDLAKLVNDTVSELKSSGELKTMIEKWGIK